MSTMFFAEVLGTSLYCSAMIDWLYRRVGSSVGTKTSPKSQQPFQLCPLPRSVCWTRYSDWRRTTAT